MIDLARARMIVDAALDHARRAEFPPMTVAVLDAAGRLVAFASEDGSSLLRGRIAQAKARGALNMGVGSRSLAARAVSHPEFVNSLVSLAGGDLVPVAGGVLIRDANDDVIGAVGVSGHDPDNDEACAIAGIAAGGLRADPGS
ncbi:MULTISPECIES: GlcG/HbpS family heme-binding protein [Mycobacterium]|uniref:GlcG/HbpS family heme-binding protein n=1 Tax=Mycobacterium TaxID=1763 RepID=UPI001CD9EB63|nr:MULTISPECIES: heme-binding protein [Mycobacterium]MCA2241996.1 heme-binding protein [Mycobacterium sp. WUMAC-067]MCA2314486.1 heme-binding protein [Mycobacterium sp. WUMAC-025]MEE3751962.1 heme-binding protein [Mycobacterium intracellulare]